MFKYLKEKGLKHALQVIWIYKIELVLEKILLVFFKHKPLKNIIMIESHNDFDCNGGAFYDYLIKNKYNEKYKIVWLVRKNYHKKLPRNVTTVPLYRPSFRKAYYYCNYKYMTFDNEGGRKTRTEQKLVFCSHGSVILKSVKGKMFAPEDADYLLMPSKNYMPIIAEQWSASKDDKRYIYIGYPALDLLFEPEKESEIKKITTEKFKKSVLWMPTFRKGIAFKRNDSTKEQPLGIPIFTTEKQYLNFNEYLKQKGILLIIKIHPKQDLSNLGIKNVSNIKVLTGDSVKKYGVDNYRLMKSVDALISDYSTAATDFMLLNKPLAFTLDDAEDYAGFAVDNIEDYMPGDKIYTEEQFRDFIDQTCDDKDPFKSKREKICRYIHENEDGKARERLVKLLKL